jgi:adenylate cyclase
MTMTHDTDQEHAASKARASGSSLGSWLHRIWDRYENSSIPLGLKWSVSIAALIVTTMGVLGFYLIQQQEAGYRDQVDRFSHVIVEQLERVSGEPLMAGDMLTLQILLQRQAQSPLILGAALHDADGAAVVEAGIGPPGSAEWRFSAVGPSSWDWENGEYKAVSYVSPVIYQDVTAGYLTVSIDRSPLEKDLQETLRFLVVSTSLMIFLGVILASVLAHRLSRPIERLARAGEALGAGRPHNALVERRDEIGQVLETFEHLAEGFRRTGEVEAAFSRYVSPQVAQQVLAGDAGGTLGGARVTGSVLFCDIVGFTQLSETRDPGEVAALLNDYFGYFALAAESCGGTVDKFIGDCIMIVFGVPTADPHHALHAMTCGMLIQQLTQRINAIRESRGQATVKLRVGISSGSMLAGNLGSTERMQYTVVGDTVNIAARLCGMAEPGGVLVLETMMASGCPGSPGHYAHLGAAQLRGRTEYVEVRAMDVEAVARDVNADQLIENILSVVGE